MLPASNSSASQERAFFVSQQVHAATSQSCLVSCGQSRYCAADSCGDPIDDEIAQRCALFWLNCDVLLSTVHGESREVVARNACRAEDCIADSADLHHLIQASAKWDRRQIASVTCRRGRARERRTNCCVDRCWN